MTEVFIRLKEILRIPGVERSEEELALVQIHTKHIEFFKKLNEEQGNEELHRACCKVMEYHFYPRNDFIFKYGDLGDTFCIILKGTVAVLQPIKKKQTDVITENSHAQAPDDEAEQQQEKQLTEEYNFIRLAELGSGASFGELSLLKSLPRSATAQCLEDTSVAIIKAADFNRLLATYEDKKLSKKVEFLSNLPFLRNWTKVSLFKLTYFFNERSYKFNQLVYKEGSPATEVFIIKSGEFKVRPIQFSKQSASIQAKPLDLNVLTTVNQASARRMLKEHKQMKEEKLWMMIKGPNEMFGDYDVIEDTPRQQTCICATRKAEVYVINKLVRFI